MMGQNGVANFGDVQKKMYLVNKRETLLTPEQSITPFIAKKKQQQQKKTPRIHYDSYDFESQ